MKPNDVERFYQALKAMEVFFRDKLTEEHELLYWNTMRDRCSIREWEYACEQAMGEHDFNTVPLPAKLLPYCLEYRAERRLAWEIKQLDARRLLSQADEPSRDPSFPGTEAERKALMAARAEAQRARLEAKWAALDAQGDKAGPRPYRKLSPDDLHYVPREDPAKAKARALSLLAELRHEQEHGNAEIH